MGRERLNECNDCGGKLIEQNRFWVCENCGAIFAMSRDDEGNPFTFHPLIKKELDFGKMAERATEISVNQISVKEIKLKDNVDADVHRETTNLERQENIRLVIMFLENEEWEAAQEQINQLLLADYLDAEAIWYEMSCSRRARNDVALANSFSTFTDADSIKLEKIIQNATPSFAKRVLNLLFKFGYSGDESTKKIIAVSLPYIHIESLYSVQERNKIIENAYDKVIACGYCGSFEYLLSHTLNSAEVDRYINYLERFAKKCNPENAQKYYSMILDVDPGNVSAHHNLIKADIIANSSSEKCIADFESLILYTKNPDVEVDKYISLLINEQKTTVNKSNFMWSLLGYHSNAPEGLKEELLRYVKLLINSELWVEARKYLNLVLSFDARNPNAYYGLCLVNMQAKNRDELISKKENLIDSKELRKAIALYQSAGDEKSAKALMELTQEQKRKKINKKLRIRNMIVITSVFVILISLYFGLTGYSNYKKYSENNIKLTVTDKEYLEGYSSNDACNFMLDISIENGSSLEVRRIDGIIRFYNADGALLRESDVWLTGSLESKKSYDYELKIQENATAETIELHRTPLSKLKITWELTKVTYNNGENKEYKNSKEKVISDLSSNNNKDDEVGGKLREKFNTMLSAFEDADVYSETYVQDLNIGVDSLNSLWYDIENYDVLLAEMYNAAVKYQNEKSYEKAYYLFSCLELNSYKDSSQRSDECYDNASTVSYDNSKPGKSGIIIQYGSSVSEVESGYDAESKIFYMDDIVEVDGRRISATDPTNDFYNKIAGKKAGDTVEIGLYRYGSYMTVTIKLGYKYF